jgi:preprotein translocase subunit Sec61beta
MANQGLSIPSTGGGLLRYSEEYPSKLRISPEAVTILIAFVIIGMLVLKAIG